MFAYLQGRVEEIAPERAVLDVQGVGYEVMASSQTLARLKRGETARLLIHMHIAQDILALYGFYTIEERSMFRRLLSVSRVGPKLALSALSTLTTAQMAAAIVTEDVASLGRVSGMGKKTAARVILELKEKLATEEAVAAQDLLEGSDGAGGVRREAAAALVALGYDGATAQKAVAGCAGEYERAELLIMDALKRLGSQ